MRFESRELAYQVYFAGGDDKKPCQGVSCGQNTCGHTVGESCGGCSTTKQDEDMGCDDCSTTKCDTNTCTPKALSGTASRNDLSLLRAQLQDALSV